MAIYVKISDSKNSYKHKENFGGKINPINTADIITKWNRQELSVWLICKKHVSGTDKDISNQAFGRLQLCITSSLGKKNIASMQQESERLLPCDIFSVQFFHVLLCFLALSYRIPSPSKVLDEFLN